MDTDQDSDRFFDRKSRTTNFKSSSHQFRIRKIYVNRRASAVSYFIIYSARSPQPGLAPVRIFAYQKGHMVRFTIFGIPVQVQPFFWITLAIIGGALRADSSAAILNIGLFVVAGFVSVLVHELGHALTARKFGAHSSITLQAFGGYAAYSGASLTRRQTFAVTAAGPAIQILLGLAAFFLLRAMPNLPPNASYFMFILMWISIVWAVLNLLPILPLDGGQMLNVVLGPQRIKITLWTTIIVAVGVGLLLFQRTGSILFPLFLGMFAWQAFQALKENNWR